MSSPIRPDDEGRLETITDHRTPTSSRRAASIVARLTRPTIALSRDLARWASPNASAQPRARVHVASSIRSADLRTDAWNTDREEEGSNIQAIDKSVAGSPEQRSPKSITAERRPSLTSRLPG